MRKNVIKSYLKTLSKEIKRRTKLKAKKSSSSMTDATSILVVVTQADSTTDGWTTNIDTTKDEGGVTVKEANGMKNE